MQVFLKLCHRVITVSIILLLLIGVAAPSVLAQPPDQPPEGPGTGGGVEYDKAYYGLDRLNTGLPEAQVPINLQTPQAALEFFVINSRQQNFRAAAHALNLNLIPEREQAERAPALAQQLNYVLNQEALINWDTLPDRPDGQVDPATNPESPLVGQPRRSILLGTLGLDGRDLAIRLQRVRVGDAPPVWVFSSNTVENIPVLYDRFGPGLLDQTMPDWAKVELPGDIPLWQWIALVIMLFASLLVMWGVHNLVAHGGVGARSIAKIILGRKLQVSETLWLRGLSEDIANPVALVSGTLAFYLLSRILLSLTGPFASTFNIILVLFIIIAFTWLGMRVITYFSDYVGKGYVNRIGSDNEIHARKVLTYITVARWILILLAVLIGISIALSQFSSFERLGISLLASASVFGIIVGIAAQSVLGNIIAGIQIAVTQPVRIGDNVFFEGNWGYVEDITYTYLTIQTWDKRRVIVPLRYFTTHPMENWSKTSSHMIKPIYLYVDYKIDVSKIRKKFAELLRNSEKWDEQTEPTVQVTGFSDETLEVRALCSAKDPTKAWTLHCELREELASYVRDLDGGRYLPRRRLVLENDPRQERAEHANGSDEQGQAGAGEDHGDEQQPAQAHSESSQQRTRRNNSELLHQLIFSEAGH